MSETFAALLLAHAAAEFLLQGDGIAWDRQARRAGPFAAHLAIVAATAALALGAVTGPALAAVAALTAALVAVILTAGCVPLSREQRLILGVGLVNAPAPGAGEAQVTKVRVAGICVTGRQASVGLADIWTARVPATGQVVLAW
ncbi:MAG: hypothetical protein N2422_04360, partial [Rhodobacteraceae bacterium]|nr:hypothetical protein [Paracoccaceae bacterium]